MQRDVHLVDRVVSELRQPCAEIAFTGRQARFPDQERLVAAETKQPDPKLAPVPELTSPFQRHAGLAGAELGQLDAVFEQPYAGASQLDFRVDEPSRAVVERLKELPEQARRLADLQFRAKLAAQRVDFGHGEACRNVVVAATLEIFLQVDTEADVVRSPLFRGAPYFQRGLLAFLVQVVGHGLEGVQRVDVGDVALQFVDLQRFACKPAQPCFDDLRRQPGITGHPHIIHDRRLPAAPGDLLAVGAIRRVRDREAGQRAGMPGGIATADLHGFCQAVEFLAAEFTEVGRDMDIVFPEEPQLIGGPAVDQYGDHLAGDRQGGAEFFLGLKGETEVHGDDDVGAHLAHDLDRQVAGYAAVDQQPSIQRLRLEDPGHRHAGVHCDHQVAGVEHHHLAAADIRRHGAKGDRQGIEVINGRDGKGEPAQGEVHVLALHQSAGQQQPRAVDTQVEIDQEAEIIGLAAVRALRTRRAVSKQHVPVRRPHDFFELVGAQA